MTTRRMFCKLMTLCGLGTLVRPVPLPKVFAQIAKDQKPVTNINEAQKYPRTSDSMPGKFPGRVVRVNHDACIGEKKIDGAVVSSMLSAGMLRLTGAKQPSEAWRMFLGPKDIIGIKVNPVAGQQLATSREIVRAVLSQLEEAGIPKKNLVIWDRREFELHEVGFTEAAFPGIRIIGTERKDQAGSFVNKEGKLYSEEMIDKAWYYQADVEEKYDAETLPFMVNEGKYSYFSKIVTQDLTKIINIPILKNAGPTVTLCMKNLAYGSISNTGRLHKQLWAETCAEVCAFPPLRDKVVLNIVDGIIGCYNGGPGANPDFITEYKTILLGTDPVAVDRVGYDIVLKKRLSEKVQKEESPRALKFLELAQDLKLGIADPGKIVLETISMG